MFATLTFIYCPRLNKTSTTYGHYISVFWRQFLLTDLVRLYVTVATPPTLGVPTHPPTLPTLQDFGNKAEER